MNSDDIKYIDNQIRNAKDMGYDAIVDLLESIKKEMSDTLMSESTKDLLWKLVDYITIY